MKKGKYTLEPLAHLDLNYLLITFRDNSQLLAFGSYGNYDMLTNEKAVKNVEFISYWDAEKARGVKQGHWGDISDKLDNIIKESEAKKDLEADQKEFNAEQELEIAE